MVTVAPLVRLEPTKTTQATTLALHARTIKSQNRRAPLHPANVKNGIVPAAKPLVPPVVENGSTTMNFK